MQTSSNQTQREIIKLLKDFRISSQTNRSRSFDTLSDDEDGYLETCPIYHDVDSQSIYGFDVIQQHPLRKSEEILWKDCECICEILRIVCKFELFSVDYKFQVPKPPAPEPAQIIRQRGRSGSVDADVILNPETLKPIRKKRWFESDSITSVHLESSLKIFHEEERPARRHHMHMNIFDSEHGFIGRRVSVMKMNFQRRNTVG